MKLYELSKIVQEDNKTLQEFLANVGSPVRSHLSPLTDDQIQLITDAYGKDTNPEALQSLVTETLSTKRFDEHDLIPCRSVRGNRVIFSSERTNMTYDWMQYGQVVYVKYIDLLGMYSRQSDYLFKPMILIEDEDLYLQWQNRLEPIYAQWIGLDEPEVLFQKDDASFERMVRQAPIGLKELLGTTAARLLKNNANITVRKLQILDDLCGTALRELYQR